MSHQNSNHSNSSAVDDKLLKAQSIPVQGDKSFRRSAISENLVTLCYEDVTTAYEGFLRGLKISENLPCLGKRGKKVAAFQWQTYTEIHQRATNVGSGLVQLGCSPSQKTFIGIYASNCVEWVLTDLACQMYSMVPVPIYDTHGPDACVYIINHADVETIVCHETKVAFLMANAERSPNLKNIVKIGNEVTDKERREAKSHGLEIVTFAQLEQMGVNNYHARKPAKPEDIFTICYTSGTTGTPKGAMISHKNITATLAGVNAVYSQGRLDVRKDDSYLSYLPLAHIYERMAMIFLFTGGARIGFYRGDPKLLIEDVQELKPTIFAAVPRILNRVYDKVMSQISESKFKKWLFGRALNSKEHDLKKNVSRGNTLWDYVVFKKIQKLFGGNLRMVTCGAASLSPKVMMFFKCSLGKCLVLEGYGQTECSGVCSLQIPYDLTAGHVGSPLPCNLVKLMDVPEKGYYAKDGKGEVCIKGPNVFIGYLKDPEKTAETIDQDGWLHTGDVGEFLENGTLRIIDRSKHIFKLAQGEYVAPEKIENTLIRSQYVEQAFVHGEGLKTYVVAIVVPDGEALKQLAKENQIEGDITLFCKNKEIREIVFQDIMKRCKEAQLNSFEKVKAIHLHPEPFSVENGLLTPTLKAKRVVILKHFREHIDKLYHEADTKLKLIRSQSEVNINLQIDQEKLK
ncbi:long-chain-fatty-acid--CoA ligase 5-like [Actinia tenebrosa]|uniref:Long-chain-fatty-acid--CoA ligase n=1 Tax=Actinia tenebrosa TaxID=6105 RepID=A0A6P8GX93_ACTTE|nr:long-chain-fatty-acid--CoA ligase 5-like [Actinia tenebrosa]